MIDLAHLEQYRENNRIEAKKALGGLPKSLWETYSAFANTMGGLLLLGVEELPDKSLHALHLPNPQRLAEEFWAILNDPNRVSVNILTRGSLSIEETGGGRILVIRVPRAQRTDRPVYIEGDPLWGSYRRSGEGDYRCTPEEVRAMQRDAAVKTQDMALLTDLSLDALDPDSLGRYRARIQACRPGHPDETDSAFLCRIGAAGQASGEALCPTAAGLLMFGREPAIRQVFPSYSLDYREQAGPSGPCTGISMIFTVSYPGASVKASPKVPSGPLWKKPWPTVWTTPTTTAVRASRFSAVPTGLPSQIRAGSGWGSPRPSAGGSPTPATAPSPGC